MRDKDCLRFASKIEVADNEDVCWPWIGGVNSDGYGQIKIEGKMNLAHKVAYKLVFGDVPDGKEIDHLCRNRRCANPWHMEPVTHVVNVMRGESPQAKNARKETCVYGHPLSGSNLVNVPSVKPGRRICRICYYAAIRRKTERRRGL